MGHPSTRRKLTLWARHSTIGATLRKVRRGVSGYTIDQQ